MFNRFCARARRLAAGFAVAICAAAAPAAAQVYALAEEQRAGVRYDSPRLGYYTAAFQHPLCGAIPVNNAAYCPRANMVLYDPIFLTALAKVVGRGSVEEGWYAVVVAIGHEWGHAIVLQTQQGVFRSGRMHEVAADCLAGAVTRAAFDSKAIDQRDVNAAYRALSVLGDEVASTHGTGRQRQEAFQFGFDNGAGRCMTATASR